MMGLCHISAKMIIGENSGKQEIHLISTLHLHGIKFNCPLSWPTQLPSNSAANLQTSNALMAIRAI